MTPRLALDTNILSTLVGEEPQAQRVAQRLHGLSRDHSLVIPWPVYAEFLARPRRESFEPEGLLLDLNITKLPVPDEAAWERAGRAFGDYARRRRRSGSDWPRRILADFVIGAQLVGLGIPLFTADPAHYRAAFPGLAVFTP